MCFCIQICSFPELYIFRSGLKKSTILLFQDLDQTTVVLFHINSSAVNESAEELQLLLLVGVNIL